MKFLFKEHNIFVTISNKFLTILTTCLISKSYSTPGSYVVAHKNHYILILCVKRCKKLCGFTIWTLSWASCIRIPTYFLRLYLIIILPFSKRFSSQNSLLFPVSPCMPSTLLLLKKVKVLVLMRPFIHIFSVFTYRVWEVEWKPHHT